MFGILGSMTAKDYFQDITPAQKSAGMQRPAPQKPVAPVSPPPAPRPMAAPDDYSDDVEQNIPIHRSQEESRGIRTIIAPRSRPGRTTGNVRENLPPSGLRELPSKQRGKWWLWTLAGVGVVVVVGLLLVALRPTTVTISPRLHAIIFSSGSVYTAYPAQSAATGTLAYTVATIDLQDSAQIAASSTPVNTQPAKASGSVTVYNGYSASSVKLIKNTRFATPDGLVFRTPFEIVIPGRKGSTPGSVKVTIMADQTGDQYNVGPTTFTVPGLSGNAAMYKTIYAKSAAAMSGGATGGGVTAGVDPATLSAAVDQLKTDLANKAYAALSTQAGSSSAVLAGLVQLTYAASPTTTQMPGGTIRIDETVHAVAPVFSAVALGQSVGSAVSADVQNEDVTLVPGSGFSSALSGQQPVLGTDPVQFSLSGQGELLWTVDASALQNALAGKNQGAFQAVIAGFPGIEEAYAKVEPFWKNTFPSNPADIRVIMTTPKAGQ